MASIWINHKIEIFPACSKLWLRSPDVERKKVINLLEFIFEILKGIIERNKPQAILGCAVYQRSDGFCLYLNLVFMLTPHVVFTWSAMANFDHHFACRPSLGLFANSVEELIHHNTIFFLDWMPNFEEEFACRSLLGLPANSIEEVLYHKKKFYWTRWRILIKILAVFHGETIRKVYRVPIYILYHKNRLQTIKKETQLHQNSQQFPYIVDYY